MYTTNIKQTVSFIKYKNDNTTKGFKYKFGRRNRTMKSMSMIGRGGEGLII